MYLFKLIKNRNQNEKLIEPEVPEMGIGEAAKS